MLSLLEVGRRLGGLTAAEVCALIVDRQLVGCLVDGCILVGETDLRAFTAGQGLRLVPTAFKSEVAAQTHSDDQPTQRSESMNRSTKRGQKAETFEVLMRQAAVLLRRAKASCYADELSVNVQCDGEVTYQAFYDREEAGVALPSPRPGVPDSSAVVTQ